MKNLLKYVLLVFAAVTLIACSEESPSFRVKNDRATKANIQIKTVNNTININDVQAGDITGYREVAEGQVTVSAEIQGETDEPSGSFNAENDYNYTIVILNSTPPSIRIDRSDK
jgi:hypothetical protein